MKGRCQWSGCKASAEGVTDMGSGDVQFCGRHLEAIRLSSEAAWIEREIVPSPDDEEPPF